MGAGDEIMAAGQAERVYTETPVAICEASGQPRWHPVWQHHPFIATPEYVGSGRRVVRIINAAGCRPYIRYPFTRETGIRFTGWRARDHRGRIYFDAREREAADRVRQALGPFLIIEPSPKLTTNPNKNWIWDRWRALVAQARDRTWVQLLHAESRVLPGTIPITSATFRDAAALVNASDGYVGTEGGLHHAAAACRKPAVVLYGGCISVDATGYEDHLNLVDDSPETPCGRWLPCAHCAQAMARISVDHVAAAVRECWSLAA